MQRGNAAQQEALSQSNRLADWLEPVLKTGYFLEAQDAPITNIVSALLYPDYVTAAQTGLRCVPWEDTTPGMRRSLQPISSLLNEQGLICAVVEFGFPGVSDYVRMYAINCVLLNCQWLVPMRTCVQYGSRCPPSAV